MKQRSTFEKNGIKEKDPLAGGADEVFLAVCFGHQNNGENECS